MTVTMTVLIIVILVVVSLLVWFFVWKANKIKQLRKIRDNFDFTTPEGRWLIRAYNYKINKLNGYYVWNSKKLI